MLMVKKTSQKKLNDSVKTGISFGLTSGTITTLGLMMGLFSGTHDKLIVIGGILTIAFADAFSDALGIHVSEESRSTSTTKSVWTATITTFLTKVLFSLTFLIPILLFNLTFAVWFNIAYGLIVIALISYKIAVLEKESPAKAIFEHLFITIMVLAVTFAIGHVINLFYGS